MNTVALEPSTKYVLPDKEDNPNIITLAKCRKLFLSITKKVFK